MWPCIKSQTTNYKTTFHNIHWINRIFNLGIFGELLLCTHVFLKIGNGCNAVGVAEEWSELLLPLCMVVDEEIFVFGLSGGKLAEATSICAKTRRTQFVQGLATIDFLARTRPVTCTTPGIVQVDLAMTAILGFGWLAASTRSCNWSPYSIRARYLGEGGEITWDARRKAI